MKDKIINLVKKYKQFILFCIVGVANTVVSYVFYRLVLLIDISFIKASVILIAASAIGDIAGAINSYILNSRLVFHNKSKSSMPKFIANFIIYLILSAALVWAFVNVVGIPESWAKLIAIPIMLIYNFFASKLWVFKKKDLHAK